MFKRVLILMSILASFAFFYFRNKNSQKEFSFEDHVKEINNSNLPWKAQNYENLNIRTNQLIKDFGVLKKNVEINDLEEIQHSDDVEIPKNFQIKDKWTCNSITDIRDQSDCGSCWAVAAESVMSDRLCIERLKNNQNDNSVFLSSADLISNCSSCGNGCDGGQPVAAFNYLKNNGIVTGGDYGNKNSCYPYPFKKCAHHVKSDKYKDCKKYGYSTPESTNTCTNAGYNWYSSKYYIREAYRVSGEENIKRELIKNGSIEADFTVLPGFMTYKSGIYNCSKDKQNPLGGHAVRMVGFGEEKGEDGVLRKYWLITNNWNESWGNHGYIKFDMSSDCGLTNDLVTGSGFYQ